MFQTPKHTAASETTQRLRDAARTEQQRYAATLRCNA